MSKEPLPTRDEVMAADAKALKAICARLGIKPKGKLDAIREAVIDELEARAKPGPPLNWEELEALSDDEVVVVLESLGFKSRGKKSKLREALAKHLGIEKPAEPAKERAGAPQRKAAEKAQAGGEADAPRKPAKDADDSGAAAFAKALALGGPEGATAARVMEAAKPAKGKAAEPDKPAKDDDAGDRGKETAAAARDAGEGRSQAPKPGPASWASALAMAQGSGAEPAPAGRKPEGAPAEQAKTAAAKDAKPAAVGAKASPPASPAQKTASQEAAFPMTAPAGKTASAGAAVQRPAQAPAVASAAKPAQAARPAAQAKREEAGPDTARSFAPELSIGIMLYDMGKYDEAIERLRRAMESATSQHEESLCSLYLGNAHYAKGRRFEATPYYDEVEEIAGLKVHATENRATASAAEGDLQQAVQIYEELIAKDPSLQRVWFKRGETLLRMGKPGAALQSFDRMEKGADGTGYLVKGMAFLRMGQSPKAREQFNEALRVSSTNRRAWLSKAALAIADRDVKEAELAVEKALKLDPRDRTAWASKAALLHLQGRNAEALEALATVDPTGKRPELRNSRAFLLLRLDRLDEARRTVEAPLSDADPEAHDILGIILARQGDEAGARKRFERALELAPDFADAAANLKRLDEAPPTTKQARQKALQSELEREIAPSIAKGGNCPRCEAKGSFIGGVCSLCGYGGTDSGVKHAETPARVRETDEPGRCPHCGFFVGEGAVFCPACEADLGGSTMSDGEKGVLEFLASIEGMDAEKATQVVRHNYRTMSLLRKATLPELVSIPGISVTLATRILEAMK